MIFADEPTGNLDPGSAAVVLGMLREQANNGACVVIVTHDPAVASAADRHINIDLPPPPEDVAQTAPSADRR